jgi:hypothetical protein
MRIHAHELLFACFQNDALKGKTPQICSFKCDWHGMQLCSMKSAGMSDIQHSNASCTALYRNPKQFKPHFYLRECWEMACVRLPSSKASRTDCREAPRGTCWDSKASLSVSESDTSDRTDRASAEPATPEDKPYVGLSGFCWLECFVELGSKTRLSLPIDFGLTGLARSLIFWYHEKPSSATV